MSTYEDGVRSALKAQFDAGELRDVGDAAAVFGSLSSVFPTSGSKIDWRHVPGSVESAEEDASLQRERFVQFFDEMQSRFVLTGPATYAGDSATDFALEGAVDAIRKALPILLEVPQHHYFMGPGCSWCICLTMEGDMGFGRSERASHD
jgi:hypothetical protein